MNFTSEREQHILAVVSSLETRIPEFGYSVITDDVLQTASKWRPVRQVVYDATLGGRVQRSDRSILKDGDGSYVFALTPQGNVILLLQLRPGLERLYQVELPADSVENGKPMINALQELKDELGASGKLSVVQLGIGPVLAGRSPQETYFYFADGIEFDVSQQKLDRGELIIPFTIPIDEVLLFTSTIMQNRLNPEFPRIGVDPKITTAIVLAAQHLNTQGDFERARKLMMF
ncbi:hypothetical protein HYW46_02005 [Candidatus Daviesbacteria bacterium]|nr:hypothetical protein [Candidatus Daviesbacteria bacterium]